MLHKVATWHLARQKLHKWPCGSVTESGPVASCQKAVAQSGCVASSQELKAMYATCMFSAVFWLGDTTRTTSPTKAWAPAACSRR